MDYNFYQDQLYLSTTNGAERAIKRLQLQISIGDQDRIVLAANDSMLMGKGGKLVVVLLADLPTFTVRLKVFGQISRSHCHTHTL